MRVFSAIDVSAYSGKTWIKSVGNKCSTTHKKQYLEQKWSNSQNKYIYKYFTKIFEYIYKYIYVIRSSKYF